jgi:hypothetical protein
MSAFGGKTEMMPILSFSAFDPDCVKTHHPRNVENTILERGLDPSRVRAV